MSKRTREEISKDEATSLQPPQLPPKDKEEAEHQQSTRLFVSENERNPTFLVKNIYNISPIESMIALSPTEFIVSRAGLVHKYNGEVYQRQRLKPFASVGEKNHFYVFEDEIIYVGPQKHKIKKVILAEANLETQPKFKIPVILILGKDNSVHAYIVSKGSRVEKQALQFRDFVFNDIDASDGIGRTLHLRNNYW